MPNRRDGILGLALLSLALAATADAGSARSEARALLRCQRQIANEGVYFTNRMNAKLARCLLPLADCALGARDVACGRAEVACADVPGEQAELTARLSARLVTACGGVGAPDVMRSLAFRQMMPSCEPSSVPEFAVCLATALTAAQAESWIRLAPAACAMLAEAGLLSAFPPGLCEVTPPPPPPGDTCDDVPRFCGGAQNVACGDGFVCDRQGGVCDPQAAGVCVPAPSGCVDAGQPVCGCDGMTYASDCDRLAAGVALAHAGACVVPCTTNADCGAGTFCESPVGDCGESQMGTCRPVDDPSCSVCGELAAGRVCGCDGNTYLSECDRRAAGASKLADGACMF
jgi:hypothetical protein